MGMFCTIYLKDEFFWTLCVFSCCLAANFVSDYFHIPSLIIVSRGLFNNVHECSVIDLRGHRKMVAWQDPISRPATAVQNLRETEMHRQKVCDVREAAPWVETLHSIQTRAPARPVVKERRGVGSGQKTFVPIKLACSWPIRMLIGTSFSASFPAWSVGFLWLLPSWVFVTVYSWTCARFPPAKDDTSSMNQ